MLCVPAVRAEVVQAAVRMLPAPVKATTLQPAIKVPPSLKSTAPVGAAAVLPVTVAVKVTLEPADEGLSELASVTELPALLTTWEIAVLEAAACSASPASTAT